DPRPESVIGATRNGGFALRWTATPCPLHPAVVGPRPTTVDLNRRNTRGATMSIESGVPDEISARMECPPEPDGNSPCVCQLPNGTKIVTTTAECKALGGTPMVETLPRRLMIPYTL